MDIQNDIEKIIESLNYIIYDIFDKADLEKEDDLNACLNNFILFATKNEYLTNLKSFNATKKNELLKLTIDALTVAYEKLEQMKNEGMNLDGKDKMACYIQMVCILAKTNFKIHIRQNTGTWPTN